MLDYLVLTAVGPDRTGIVTELSDGVQQLDCSIDDSRMALLGGEFSIIMMVSGESENIAKLKDALPQLEQKTGLKIIAKTTSAPRIAEGVRAMAVEVVATDAPGIVHNVTRFFSDRGINIDTLATDRYPAPHTGTPTFELDMGIHIPADVDLDALQNDFQALCDEMELEGSIETM